MRRITTTVTSSVDPTFCAAVASVSAMAPQLASPAAAHSSATAALSRPPPPPRCSSAKRPSEATTMKLSAAVSSRSAVKGSEVTPKPLE